MNNYEQLNRHIRDIENLSEGDQGGEPWAKHAASIRIQVVIAKALVDIARSQHMLASAVNPANLFDEGYLAAPSALLPEGGENV